MILFYASGGGREEQQGLAVGDAARQPQQCHIPAGDLWPWWLWLGKQWQEGGIERRGRGGCQEKTEVTGEDFPGHKRGGMCAKGNVGHLLLQTRSYDTADLCVFGFYIQVKENISSSRINGQLGSGHSLGGLDT